MTYIVKQLTGRLKKVSSAHGQTTREEASSTRSQSPPMSDSSTSLDGSSTLASLSPPSSSSSSPSVVPETTSTTGSKTTPELAPPLTTTLSGPTDPSISGNGPDGLSIALVATIAVGATLIALLLLAIAVYCCLKRRTARRGARPRALTLSRGIVSGLEFDDSSGRKRKLSIVELPPHSAATQAELEDSLVFRAQLDDASAAPDTPSTLSAISSRKSAPFQPSPVELFVVPAELPGRCKG